MNLSLSMHKNQLKEELSLVLMLIPFFQPGCFLYMSFRGVSFSNIFNLMKIIVTIIFFLTHRIHFEKLVTSKTALLLSITALGSFISISNIIHNSSIMEISTVLSFFAFCFMCQYYLKKEKNIFISVLMHIFGVYNILQIITVILYYPNGIFNDSGPYWEMTLAVAKYFFGTKNQAIFYMLAFLVCFILYSEIEKKKYHLKCYVASAAFLVELYILDSSASIICLVAFFVLALSINEKIRRIISWAYNPVLIFAISFIFFFVICIANQASYVPFLKQFLSLFGRNVTFTNRIYIWGYALSLFLSNPLLGVGEVSFYVMGTEITQAHNMYLDIMYKYGLFAIIFYIITLAVVVFSLCQYKEGRLKCVLSTLLMIMMIHNCFDAMDNYIFILFANIFVCFSQNDRRSLNENFR